MYVFGCGLCRYGCEQARWQNLVEKDRYRDDVGHRGWGEPIIETNEPWLKFYISNSIITNK